MRWTSWRRDVVVAILAIAPTVAIGFCISWRLVRTEQIRAEKAERELATREADKALVLDVWDREEKLIRLIVLGEKIARERARFESEIKEWEELRRLRRPFSDKSFDDMLRPPVQPEPREQKPGKRDS